MFQVVSEFQPADVDDIDVQMKSSTFSKAGTKRLDIVTEVNKIENLYSLSSTSLKKVESAFDKETMTTILNDLANALLNRLNIKVIGSCLYFYVGSIWQPLFAKDFPSFVKLECADLEKLLRHLGPQHYLRLYETLLSEPRIFKDLNKIPDYSSYINFKDGILDLYTGNMLRHDPNWFFFNNLNLSSKELRAKSTGAFDGLSRIALQGI